MDNSRPRENETSDFFREIPADAATIVGMEANLTNDISGKVALVTGGSRGIGAAIAARLAREGADVALTYQYDAERAAEVAGKIKDAGRRTLVAQIDSADPEAVTAIVDRTAAELGRLDILVNNAGAFHIGGLGELGWTDFEETMNVNVRAPFVAAQAAVKHMTNGGRIISIGSNVAERTVFPGFSAYATSKAALIGMTKALSRELGPSGITVNLASPGPIDTDLNPADGPNAETINGFVALGRYGEPRDIAAAVAYLAGEAGRYVTGATLNVDGGFNS